MFTLSVDFIKNPCYNGIEKNSRRRIMAKKKKMSKKGKIILFSVIGVLVAVFLLNMVVLPLTGGIKRADADAVYTGQNAYVRYDKGLYLSAHRAGGDIEPEETMRAFKNCMEAPYKVDVVEFDLHLTADEKLVLLHDDEVDRTSDGPIVFGKKGVKVCDKTLEELMALNFGYHFQKGDGSYPYREQGADLSEVRILPLTTLLTYLEEEARPDQSLKYIIEIKDDGKRGKQAMDILFSVMEEYKITERVVVGTFHQSVTSYIDKKYPQVTRSASITDMLGFYYDFLYNVNVSPEKLGFSVLQIPMGLKGYFDFATEAFVSYAHAHGFAVQYWTINDPEDVAFLQKIGADCIMTDDPEMAWNVLSTVIYTGENRK